MFEILFTICMGVAMLALGLAVALIIVAFVALIKDIKKKNNK